MHVFVYLELVLNQYEKDQIQNYNCIIIYSNRKYQNGLRKGS